jgi:hypothetical protein
MTLEVCLNVFPPTCICFLFTSVRASGATVSSSKSFLMNRTIPLDGGNTWAACKIAKNAALLFSRPKEFDGCLMYSFSIFSNLGLLFFVVSNTGVTPTTSCSVSSV